MPNPLDTRPLHQRFDLKYVHRRRWPRNVIFWVSVIASVATLAVLTALSARQDERIYSSGPLSRAHAMIGDHCAHCHQPANDGGYWLPATDAACLRCHVAEAHHPQQMRHPGHPRAVDDRLGDVAMEVRCIVCHTEHRGHDYDLSRVADTFCVQCHADLSQWRDLSTASGDHATLDIAPSRPARVEPPANEPIADRITAFLAQRTDALVSHPEFRVVDPAQPRIDTTWMKFGHDKHMDPETPLMDERLAAWVESQREAGVPDSKIPVTRDKDGHLALSCAACHQPDDAGRYMKPIVFEQHCRQCHPLGKMPTGESVPHGAAIKPFLEAIVARDLWKDAAEAPQPATGGVPSSTPTPGPRPGPAPGPKPGPRAEATTLDSTLSTDSASVRVAEGLAPIAVAQPRPGPRPGPVGPKSTPATSDTSATSASDLQQKFDFYLADATYKLVSSKCSKCHVQLIDVAKPRRPSSGQSPPTREAIDLTGRDLAGIEWKDVDPTKVDWSKVDNAHLDWTKVDWATIHGSNWSIVDPHIPDRWMPRSVFDHAGHASIRCTECHAGADPKSAPPEVPQVPATRLTWRLGATGRTREIMMPSIETCRRCHHAPTAAAPGARNDCVTCHIYHEDSSGGPRSTMSRALPLSPADIEHFLKGR